MSDGLPSQTVQDVVDLASGVGQRVRELSQNPAVAGSVLSVNTSVLARVNELLDQHHRHRYKVAQPIDGHMETLRELAKVIYEFYDDFK
jgi:hypothetical protein